MEQNDRKEQILEAAIRRFAHFGVQKTTLTEIAEDLGMTKQALAYYYPDKHSLSDAVEEEVIEAFFNSVDAHFAKAGSSGDAILELADVKKSFFEKYAMLMQTARAELTHSPRRIVQSKQKVRSRLIELITVRLEYGVQTGEFKALDAPAVAALLFETLTAFEYCTIGRQLVPDANTLNELCTKQKAVVQLMINGLKQEAWKR